MRVSALNQLHSVMTHIFVTVTMRESCICIVAHTLLLILVKASLPQAIILQSPLSQLTSNLHY